MINCGAFGAATQAVHSYARQERGLDKGPLKRDNRDNKHSMSACLFLRFVTTNLAKPTYHR